MFIGLAPKKAKKTSKHRKREDEKNIGENVGVCGPEVGWGVEDE